MALIIDEIQDEIERERFFARVRKLLPYLASAFLLILVGTGVYLWRSHVGELRLYEKEKMYVGALESFSKGEFAECRHALETLAKDESVGYGFLARLQLAKLSWKTQFEVSRSPKAWREVRDLLAEAIKGTKGSSVSFESFFAGVLDFLSMEMHEKFEENQKVIDTFFMPYHPWRWVGLESRALWSYLAGNKDMGKAFAAWSQGGRVVRGGGTPWTSEIVASGAEVALPIAEEESGSKKGQKGSGGGSSSGTEGADPDSQVDENEGSSSGEDRALPDYEGD